MKIKKEKNDATTCVRSPKKKTTAKIYSLWSLGGRYAQNYL